MFLATRISVKALLVVVAACAFIFSVSQLHQPRWAWEIVPEKVSEDRPALREDKKESPCPALPTLSVPIVKKQPWEDPTSVLMGRPTKAFRNNLRKDKFYITAWSNAGFTNQFMSYVNMVYLGLVSNRIPIIPPFAPDHHMPQEAGALPFGNIFNMTILRNKLQLYIPEWSEVKQIPSLSVNQPDKSETEALGCWSSRHGNDPNPLSAEAVVRNLRLDPSYTRAPTEARNNPSDGQDDFLVVGKLVPYIFPTNPLPPPNGVYTLMAKSRLNGHTLLPDTHLTCFDFLYYVMTSAQAYEWRFSWSPVWRTVGTHLRFTDSLMKLARSYLRTALELDTWEPIPPFIAVHARRGDFINQCSRPGHCLAPLEAFEIKVNKMKKGLLYQRQLEVNHVLLFSNDPDPEFWHQVADLGWKFFDHVRQETEDRYGMWYPVVIDIAVQSLASGFIGTEDSTFSLVSAKRVTEWNNGLAEDVKRDDTI